MRIEKKKSVGKLTQYFVRSSTGTKYMVSVDEDGMWACTCPGGNFRGYCYHVLSIKWNREWRHLVPTLEHIRFTPVSEVEFNRLLEIPRFILQPLPPHNRTFICFARTVWDSHRQADELVTKKSERLAGTVLEGWRGKEGYVVWDLLFYKGIDYRQLPLRDRLMRLSDITNEWRAAKEAMMEIDIPLKRGIKKWSCGKVVLRDIAAPYKQQLRAVVVLK